MKVLLVDDEKLARDYLKHMLLELDSGYELLAEAANGEEALQACKRDEVDIVLMDIHMPGMDGMQAASVLSDQPLPPAIIFTTAYSEHALSAFEVSAVDYLLKPVRREKLLAALNKAAALKRSQLVAPGEEEAVFLVSHTQGSVQRILLDDVYYLRADNKYVTARHLHGEALLEDSLKSLVRQFSGQLLRVHRNALVNMRQVSGLEKQPGGQLFLTFKGIEDKLEVSRRNQAEVREAVKR